MVAAWRHPLLARAREADRAGRCRREVPIRLRLGDGGLCEGTVDLAFEERDGWLVVDFKTDRALGLDERVYAFQVALYAEAIAKATNRPARAMLVRI